MRVLMPIPRRYGCRDLRLLAMPEPEESPWAARCYAIDRVDIDEAQLAAGFG